MSWSEFPAGTLPGTTAAVYRAATGIVANCPGRVCTTVAAVFPEGFTRIRPLKSEKSISWSQDPQA